jgi:hypothetical protein
LDQWAKTWLVDFNPKKTKALIISNNSNIPELNIRFNDESVELVDNHKHLGVTFVSDGNWTVHIENVMSLIYNKNNKGPSTDPWGTPALTRPESDSSLFTNTNCLLPHK